MSNSGEKESIEVRLAKLRDKWRGGERSEDLRRQIHDSGSFIAGEVLDAYLNCADELEAEIADLLRNR